MKFFRNISIKWKIIVPIVILAFLMVAACLQANIATSKMMDTKYVKDIGIKGDGVYVSFVANSPNAEISKQFVTYLLSQ